MGSRRIIPDHEEICIHEEDIASGKMIVDSLIVGLHKYKQNTGRDVKHIKMNRETYKKLLEQHRFPADVVITRMFGCQVDVIE